MSYLGPGLAGIAVLTLLLSVADASGKHQEIISGDHATSRVVIEDVHSTERANSKQITQYYSEVTVALPDDSDSGSTTPATGKLRSNRPPSAGDHTWALYAPQDHSQGVILGTRAEIGALTGGPLPLHVLATVVFLVLLFAGFGWSEFRQTPPARRMRAWVAAGGLGAAPVRISGASAGRYLLRAPKAGSGFRRSDISPALVLTDADGGRIHLFVERCVASEDLAADTGGQPARLYWPSKEKAEAREAQGVPAVVFLQDGRYLYGMVPASQLPADPEEAALPENSGDSRAVGPYLVHRSGLHRPGVIGAVTGFVAAVLLVTGMGFGGYWESGWLQASLMVALVAAPGLGYALTVRNRSRELRRLQGHTDGFVAPDPEAVAGAAG